MGNGEIVDSGRAGCYDKSESRDGKGFVHNGKLSESGK